MILNIIFSVLLALDHNILWRIDSAGVAEDEGNTFCCYRCVVKIFSKGMLKGELELIYKVFFISNCIPTTPHPITSDYYIMAYIKMICGFSIIESLSP